MKLRESSWLVELSFNILYNNNLPSYHIELEVVLVGIEG